MLDDLAYYYYIIVRNFILIRPCVFKYYLFFSICWGLSLEKQAEFNIKKKFCAEQFSPLTNRS